MSRTTAITLLAGLFAIGCSSDPGPPTAPVSGVVTFKGEPVKYAKVMFFPQGIEGGHISVAHTDEEGRFTGVRTGQSRDTSGGAVVGSHFVTITEDWPPDEPIPETEEGMEMIPPRQGWAQAYRDSTDPKIKVDIVAGQDNHFEWELTE